MKKIVLFGLVCAMSVSNANAGWFSNLFNKSAEPATLAEACNTDEITTICPDVVLGEKTLTECLSENVKSLSKKCAKFVKKSVKENKELVLGNADSATNSVSEQVTEVKAQKETAKKSLKNKKAEVKAAGKEIKQTAQAIKADAKDTAKSVKEIVK